MSNKIINARIKNKRDTDSNWQSKNPVLLNGEIILVDMNDGELRAKVGNGTSRYNQLSFSDEILRSLINNTEDKVGALQDLVGDTAVSDQIESAIVEHTHPIDSALSSTSTNPVQNKVVFNAVQALIDGLGNEPVADQIENAINEHTHEEYVNKNAFGIVNVDGIQVSSKKVSDTLYLTAGPNIDFYIEASQGKIMISAVDTKYTHPTYDVAAGTYNSVTVNAQGHVTAGSNPTTLDGYGITDAATKSELDAVGDLIGDVAVSEQINAAIEGITLSSLGVTATAKELNYVDGVTSNIQKQLNDKTWLFDWTGSDSYVRTVIALCEVATANSTLNSYSIGKLGFHRVNGLTGACYVDVAVENHYGSEGINISFFGSMYAPENVRPCTFTYNGKKYGGVEVFFANANLQYISFTGQTNITPFGVEYYKTDSSTAINSEINDSINFDEATYTGNLYYNGLTMLTNVLPNSTYGTSLPSPGTAGRIFFKKV